AKSEQNDGVETAAKDDGKQPAKAPDQRPQLSTHAAGEIRRKAAAKARRDYEAQLEQSAKRAGFKSHAAMVEAAAAAKRGVGKPAAPGKDDKDVAALQAEVASLREQNQRLLRKLAGKAKMAKRAERAQRRVEAEMELRVAATRHGVQDVDYAVSLVKRKL